MSATRSLALLLAQRSAALDALPTSLGPQLGAMRLLSGSAPVMQDASTELRAAVPSSSSSAGTSLATRDSTATAATAPSGRGMAGYLPGWLRSLLPGGKDLQAGPGNQPSLPSSTADSSSTASAATAAGTSAPSTSSAAPAPAASADAARRKEYVEYLEKYKDLTVDDFVALTKEMRSATDPPRPKLPPVARSHPEYKRFIDWQRVSYLRTLQHEKIGSVMTAREKARLLREGKEVLKDKRFVQAIANRTGVYIHYEVQDCIRGFLDMRDHMRRLYRYSVVAGEPEPATQEEQNEVLQTMKEVEEREEELAKLERQDPSHCPILPILDMMGHDATCSRTGLKYHLCCGRAAGRPPGLVVRDRQKDLEGLRGRKVPRAEREMREGLRERADANKWGSV